MTEFSAKKTQKGGPKTIVIAKKSKAVKKRGRKIFLQLYRRHYI
jgi:hypothetical protein